MGGAYNTTPPTVCVVTTVPLPNPTGSWRPYLAKKMIISKPAFPASAALVWSASMYMSSATLALTSCAKSRLWLVAGAFSSPIPIVHEKSRFNSPRSSRVMGRAVSERAACGKAWMEGFVSFAAADSLAGLKGYSHVMEKTGAVELVG
jgi:hypothetical protein